MIEGIAFIIALLIAYKLFRLGGWTSLINQYKVAAVRMGLDGDEALDRLKLYWDTSNLPSLNGKKEFRKMMQPNGIQSDPHAHTVQVIWHTTNDIMARKYKA
jgi:hypothetical protein